MARTYRGRWRWESQRRKELLLLQGHYHQQSLWPSTTVTMFPPQINTVMLTNLTDGLNNYIGQGSFGIVKLQLYHGIYVAVKQFLPWTFINDIRNETKCVMKLSHPNLPHFLGFAQKSSHIALWCDLKEYKIMGPSYSHWLYTRNCKRVTSYLVWIGYLYVCSWVKQ